MTDARITLDAAALKARIATLEAELAEARTARGDGIIADLNFKLITEQAHANALRDALLRIQIGCGCGCDDFAAKALAQTPAASLAAHDAEVGLRVVSECAMTMRSRCSCSHCDENEPGWKGREIVERALAAQAATHTEERWECPTCGLGVSADEDGCCSTCGADCTTKPATVTIQAQEVKP